MKTNWFAIKSENGGRPYWIASGEGDPSRTTLLEFAKLFTSKVKAEKYREKVIKENPHRPHLEQNLYVQSVKQYLIEGFVKSAD